MRILTYKRTHVGDPDPSGRFGINRCMGRIRDYSFDAVIGVGGISAEPRREGIAEKINWVGIGPKRHSVPEKRASEVTFQYFLYLEEDGPILKSIAPNLAKRLYDNGARILLHGYEDIELSEAQAIIEWAKSQISSKTARVNNPLKKALCGKSCEQIKSKKKCGC